MNLDPRLLKWARQAGLALTMTVLFGLAGAVLVVWQARQVTSIVSGVFLSGMDLAAAAPYFLGLLAVIGLRALASIGVDVSANDAALQIKTRLRMIFSRHLINLGPAAIQRQKTAELTNTAIQGIEGLDAYFSQYLPQLAMAGLVPLVILIAVFPKDLLSGVVLTLTAPLIPIFMVLIGKASQAITHRQWTSLSRLSDYFLDSIQGLRELKQLGQSKQRCEQIGAAAERYRVVTMQVLRVTFLSALALELAATISTAVIAVEIGLRLLYGQMNFDQAFFILLLAPEFYQPLRLLGQRFHAAMTGVSAARQIFALLDLPTQPAQVQGGVDVDLSRPFAIRFESVSYTYPDKDQPALDRLTFEIRSGEQVALVGPSGAGKSTIAQFLLRFIQPESGEIRFNDIPLAKINLESWRRQVAWVPQRPFLFNDSIEKNISPLAGKEDNYAIQFAIERAGLAEVIRDLPQGIDTPIGESGGRLSGGEAQRLALARAYFVAAPLLILDEPTAYLDPLQAANLEQSLGKLVENKTALIIAHSLQTVMNADRILVVDGGRIVESGTHAELLASKAAYFEMVQAFRGRM